MEFAAFIISVLSLVLAVANMVMSQIHDRKKDTLDAFNVLQEQVIDKILPYTVKRAEEIKHSNQDADYRLISTSLARIEHFCVGVNQGIYDFVVLRELAKERIIITYYILKPIIDQKEKIGKGNYYANFRKVVEKLEASK